MAIEKVLRRFRIPSKNIDWALTRHKDIFGSNILTLYKNSKIPGTTLDCFTKTAQKEIQNDGGKGFYDFDKKIYRTQFNSKGEEIGRSEVVINLGKRHKSIRLKANDQSINMSDGIFKIDDRGVKVVNGVLDLPAHDFKIQFMGEKLTPMAKRILKLFNQAINK